MGYPPTDYLGYTIKINREVYKIDGIGFIFPTRKEAEKAIENLALKNAEVINIEGNL